MAYIFVVEGLGFGKSRRRRLTRHVCELNCDRRNPRKRNGPLELGIEG